MIKPLFTDSILDGSAIKRKKRRRSIRNERKKKRK
jgi:hypothetical protein